MFSHRRLSALLAFTCGLLPAQAALAIPGMGLIGSTADPHSAAALWTNPAGIGLDPGHELFLAPPAGPGSTLGAFTSWDGWSLGVTQDQNQIGTHGPLFALGSGGEILPGLRFGSTMRFSGGLDWDLGLLYRPWNFLSLGASGLNLAQNDGLGRIWDLGAAVRPFTDRLDLSADVLWDSTNQPTLDLGIAGSPVVGIKVRVWGRPLLNGPTGQAIGVGLGLRLPQLEIGGMGGAVPGGYVQFDQAHKPTVFEANGDQVAILDLSNGLVPPQSPLVPVVIERPAVFPALAAIDAAKNDPTVGGLIVRIGPLNASMAEVQELRQALFELRASGKQVIAYVADAAPKDYYLAMAADRIVMNPVSSLDITGFSRTFTYLGGTMRKLGVKWDVVAQGKFKTAPEQLTRSHLSRANIQQYQTYLQDVFGQFLTGLERDRHLTPSQATADVNRGLYTAKEALAAHLVDSLGYPDHLLKDASAVLQGRKVTGYNAFGRLYANSQWAAPPQVAVILIKGDISGGPSRSPLFSGPVSGARTIGQAIREAREQGVKAMVVRVESPGGEVTASEDIRRQLALTQRKHIPVIISMGDMGASGAYWLSAGANRIYSDGATLTGSIGVFAMKPVFAGLYHKLGLNDTTLTEGLHADMDEATHSWTPQEHQMIEAQTAVTYRQFVARVAKGRHMTFDQVVKIAGGHVWSGERAMHLGLVDRIGGLEQALGEARKLAHISGPMGIDFYPVISPFGVGGIQDRVLGLANLRLLGQASDQVDVLRDMMRPGVRMEALPPGFTP